MIKKIISLTLSLAVIFSIFSVKADVTEADRFIAGNGYSYPSVTPAGINHPRVLMNSDDILRIKSNLNHPQNESVYNHLVNKSNMYCNGILGAREQVALSNINTSYLEIMESCAFLYAVEGNTEKGKKAVTIARNILKTLDNKPDTDSATRIGGQCIFEVSLVYDWCYPLIGEYKDEIISGILKHAALMEIGWPPDGGSDVLGHSLEAQLFKDMLTAGIAVYDENTDIYNMAASRILSGFVPSRSKSYNSFEFSEGNSYGSFRYVFELICSYLFKAIGYAPFDEKQKNPAYGMLYQRRPDGKYISTGDNVTNFIQGYDNTYSSAYFLAGNLYKDSYIKREYYRDFNTNKLSNMGIADLSPALYLIINDVSVLPDKTFRDLPLTFYSEGDINTLISRTTWNEGADSNSLLVKMNMGGYNYGNHQHLDAGHFDIYYKGNLAVDSGIYESEPYNDENGTPVTKLSYASAHDMNYHKRTVAHNSMLVYDPEEITNSVYTNISDGGQRMIHGSGFEPKTVDDMSNEENKTSDIISCDFGPDVKNPSYSYIRGNLTKAYTDKVSDYSRSFLFLNFFDDEYPGALIVLDNITTSDSQFKKSWLLHTEEEPTISENTVSSERTKLGYNGKIVNNTLLPKNPVITKTGGKGNEFISAGVNYKAVGKSEYQEAGNYRVEISPSVSETNTIFLNVMTVYDSDKNSKLLSAELLSDDNNFASVKIKDRICYIAKNDALVSSDININVEEYGNTYIVTGLKEGCWKLKTANGAENATLYSYPGRNSVSFIPKTGEYILTYADEVVSDGESLCLLHNIKSNNDSEADIKIGKTFKTFKNKPLMISGELYLSADEIISEFNPEFEKATDYLYKNGLNTIEFYRMNRSFSVKGKLSSSNRYYSYDGIIYVPAIEFLSSLGHNVRFDGIANILYITKVQSEDITPVATIKNLNTKYDLSAEKHHITLDVELSGVTAEFNDNITLVMAGKEQGKISEKINLCVNDTPEEMYPYYFGQSEIINNTAHFDFYVSLPESMRDTGGEFYILSGGVAATNAKTELSNITPLPYIYDAMYKVGNGHYLFGKASENKGDILKKWGLIYSEINSSPKLNENGSLELQSKYGLNDLGQYGILMLLKNKKSYYVRAYAVYENENAEDIVIYGDTKTIPEEE